MSAIYVWENERQIGPLTRQQLRAMLSSARISPETLAAEAGDEDWRPAGEIAAQEDVEDLAARRLEEATRLTYANEAAARASRQAKASGMRVEAIAITVVVAFFGVAIGWATMPSWAPSLYYRMAKADAGSTPARAPRDESVVTSPWDGVSTEAKAWFRRNLNDPSSLSIVEASPVVKQGDGYLQRVKYRAKNRLGALTLEQRIFVFDSTGKVISTVSDRE